MAPASPPGPPAAPPVSVAGESGTEALDLDLKIQWEGLQQRVHAQRRRSFWLGNSTIVTFLAGAGCWLVYYLVMVYGYAALDPGKIRIERDAAEPDRLVLIYHPQSGGRVGFSRTGVERGTEVLDRVMPDQVGKDQQLHWRVGGLRTGDVIEVTFRSGLLLDSRELAVPEPPSAPVLGDGALAGQVLSAADNRPVAGAEVRVVGTRLSAHTDAQGRFRLEQAPTGAVPIEVSAPGFSTQQLERKLISGGETPVRVALNPGMEAGRIRIDLTWEDTSLDLDAHLTGPLPDGQQFHVYYHEMGDLRSREFVKLEADEDFDGGPETISVLGVLPGTYRYFVHDYTNREKPQSTSLARSGAEVVVQQGGQTYRFRAGHDRPGNVWNVCTIEVTPGGAVVKKVDSYEGTKAEALGLYAKRTRSDRSRWISRYGGSRGSEDAVAAGLDWLARHQAADGSWSNYCLGDEDPRSRCEKDGPPCTLAGDKYEMAQTGLALLAFQAGGHYYFNKNTYSAAVRKGLDWMISRQQPDGALVSATPLPTGVELPSGGHSRYHRSYMYDHGIATFALAEACAVAADQNQEPDNRYMEAARRAVRFIESQQHTDGSWRYNDNFDEPGDSSVAGWQVLALKSAKEAGIPPTRKCVAKIRGFFHRLETGENGRTWYQRLPRPVPPLIETEATTGIGMLVRQFLLDEADAPMVREAAAYLARYAEEKWGDHVAEVAEVAEERDFYLWYNCTLAMYQVGGRHWARWNAAIRDTILPLQRIDGCARGSWDPISKWGKTGGRIYSTALAVLTLEVYYRYAGRDETLDWFEINATAERNSQEDAPKERVKPGSR